MERNAMREDIKINDRALTLEDQIIEIYSKKYMIRCKG